MSTRTYELTVPVRKGERGMGIVVNPENCVIELAADGPAMADGRLHISGGGGARVLWSGGAAPGTSTTQGRVKDAVGEIAAMADAALRLKPSPNSAAVWRPEGDGDGLTEVEATEGDVTEELVPQEQVVEETVDEVSKVMTSEEKMPRFEQRAVPSMNGTHIAPFGPCVHC